MRRDVVSVSRRSECHDTRRCNWRFGCSSVGGGGDDDDGVYGPCRASASSRADVGTGFAAIPDGHERGEDGVAAGRVRWMRVSE